MFDRRSLLGWSFASIPALIPGVKPLVKWMKGGKGSKFDSDCKDRLALFSISNSILEETLPDGKKLTDLNTETDYRWIEKLLHIPYNCEIVRISTHFRFSTNITTIIVRSPIFVETPECCTVPDICGIYQQSESEEYFVGWSGKAALGRSEFYWYVDGSNRRGMYSTLMTWLPKQIDKIS